MSGPERVLHPIRARAVRPLSEFRARTAEFLEHVRLAREPLILTRHGRATAALLDIESYEAMIDELELWRDLRDAEAEVAASREEPHELVVARLRARLLA